MLFFRLKAFMAVKAIESFPTKGLWLPGWAQMGTKKLIKNDKLLHRSIEVAQIIDFRITDDKVWILISGISGNSHLSKQQRKACCFFFRS
jgi:hypothetical protein